MPFHDWSEKTFDWKSLYAAEREAGEIMLKYGRIGVNSKEKYGTIRWDLSFFDGTIHSLTHPGYYYNQFPRCLYNFTMQYKVLFFLTPFLVFWQKLVAQYAFTVICDKYPHIIKEILCDAPENVLPPDLERIRASMWVNYEEWKKKHQRILS